jgi:preflagellin peptidase FlaK
MNILLNYIPIVFLGLVTIFTDVKHSKIRNKHLLIGIGFVFIVKITEFLFLEDFFFKEYFYTIFFTFLVAYIFWLIRIWPAGDAKLMIIFSMLIPNSFFSNYSGFFPFDLLINSFVPIFFISFFLLIFKTKINRLKEALVYSFSLYNISVIFMIIVGFLWFFQEIMLYFGLPNNFVLNLIFLFVFFEIFQYIGSFSMEITFFLFAVIRLIIDFDHIYTFKFFYDTGTLLLSFIILRYFIVYIGYFAYTKLIKINDLKPGMIPAEGIIKAGEDDYRKIKLIYHSFIEMILNMSSDGITKENIDNLKKLYSEGKLNFDYVLIHSFVPFAIFLFFGYLITIVIKSNFIYFMSNIL